MPIQDILEHARDLAQTRYALDRQQTDYSIALIATRFPFSFETTPSKECLATLDAGCCDALGPSAVSYDEGVHYGVSHLRATWVPEGRWFRAGRYYFFADRDAFTAFVQSDALLTETGCTNS